MAMKKYFAFPKTPTLLKPHHQIVLCHIQETLLGSLSPLQKCCWYILWPHPTGQAQWMVRHYQYGATIAACLSSLVSHRWLFKYMTGNSAAPCIIIELTTMSQSNTLTTIPWQLTKILWEHNFRWQRKSEIEINRNCKIKTFGTFTD